MTEHVRLLICHTCKTVQELPDYEGPAERDDTLNFRVSEHRFSDGSEHFGIMGRVEAAHWNKPSHRDEIVAKIREAAGMPGTGSGMGESYYDVKSNFQMDALGCWQQHNRTHDCDEYQSDRKRLYPDTKAERKSEGLPAERPSTFLCDFCPVHSLVMQRKRHEQGYY